MKHFLVPLLLSALPVAACAQAPPPTAAPATALPDTARSPRHEFGLTASPLLASFFTANRALPVGLLYKRQLSPRTALRARLVGRYEGDHVVSPNDHPEGDRQNTINVQLFGGAEAVRRLSPHWTAGYGAELGLGLARTRSERRSRSSDDTGNYDYATIVTTTTRSVQTRFFASLSWQAWRNLRVFTETALEGEYYWRHRKPEVTYPANDPKPSPS